MAFTEIRERRTQRYRNLLVPRAVQMKNKIAVLLMEAGVAYNKQRFHQARYFRELLATNQIPSARALKKGEFSDSLSLQLILFEIKRRRVILSGPGDP